MRLIVLLCFTAALVFCLRSGCVKVGVLLETSAAEQKDEVNSALNRNRSFQAGADGKPYMASMHQQSYRMGQRARQTLSSN